MRIKACHHLLSEYSTWVGQHKGLYNAYLALKNSPEFATYSVAQKKANEKMHCVILSFQVSVCLKKNKTLWWDCSTLIRIMRTI